MPVGTMNAVSTSDSETYKTQRQAAARNRAAILEAAHDLLMESPAASMNEIAKRAGVGAGTLYRHFPTREALILAVYRHDIQRLVDSVDDVIATHPPIEAFTTWLGTLAEYVRVKHGLGEALHNARDPERRRRDLRTSDRRRRQAPRRLRRRRQRPPRPRPSRRAAG